MQLISLQTKQNKIMKKILYLFIFVLIGFTSHAQFKIGAHVGAPSGDVSDFYSTTLGVDLYKMFGTDRNGLLKLGIASGFVNHFGDEVKIETFSTNIDNAQFIPIAGAARINFLLFTVGPDIGYAFGISDGLDNGFYWKGVAGVKLLKILEIDLYYSSVTIDDTNFDSVGIGALLRF